MEIDLIVFDMAGTTVHDGDAVQRALEGALAAAGVRASREQINAVMGMPKPVAIQTLLAEFRGQAAASDRTVEAAHDDFLRRMLWHYGSHPDVRECPGASEIFAWCRRMGIHTAIDTGFSRAIADAILARLGWREAGLLDATVASDEVARGRPYPDMIQHLMAATDVTDPARVMKVGDTPVDIAQGHAAGCRYVVAVTSGSHTEDELRPHRPTHLIAALRELKDVLGLEEEEGVA